jgi:hypothetical protein
VSDRSERLGINEALFREVNERIDQLHGDLGGEDSFEIVCECGSAGCIERFLIMNDEYSVLRADVHRFAVVPGHERPEIERTIATHSSYLVVEKTDPDAAEAAEEMA